MNRGDNPPTGVWYIPGGWVPAHYRTGYRANNEDRISSSILFDLQTKYEVANDESRKEFGTSMWARQLNVIRD